MSRPVVAPRPFPVLLTAVLAALVLVLGLASSPAWAAGTADAAAQTTVPPGEEATDEASVTDDATGGHDAASTDAPPAQQPAAAPAPEDFEVEFTGPECWDSSYNVWVMTDVETDGLRLALQEDVDGAWVTLGTERFYDGEAFLYSDFLDEGESAAFRVVVYHRSSPAEQTVLHGPMTVTGVSTEGCEDWDFPFLPEEQWTVAEAGCATVTFTSRAEQDVVVLWFGIDDEDDWDGGEESYFVLTPGESRAVETTHGLLYWISVTGVDADLEPIEDELYYAGEGEVEVRQDCAPAPGEPEEPGEGPAQSGDDHHHKVPGRVQTDGGASAPTVVVGLGLMVLAGAALVRRRV